MNTQVQTRTFEHLLDVIQPKSGGREIHDPATGAVVGLAPEHNIDDLQAAIAAAHAAQPGWALLSHCERSEYLNRAADAIEIYAEALAELLSREQGKPLNGANARFEVQGCIGWLRATAAMEVGPEILIDEGDTRAELHYKPLGVVGAIGPWNWPMMIAIWQIAPALKMGNSVVVKPSEYTPLSVLALAHVLNTVLPTDVMHVISGGSEVGAALTGHPGISKIMFTGSTTTGKAIIRSSADSVKRLTLELGGNDPGIVLPDADPAAIAQNLFWGAFINTGQTCAALKRLYVHEDIYDQVVDALADVATRVPMGIGLDERNMLGPLQNKVQFDIVSRLVEAARDSGARIVTGGNPDPDQAGYFYPVTLVAEIDNNNPLVSEEQFGPALPIIKYSSVEKALKMANGLDVGLGASVWSSNISTAREIASKIQAGTVWINKHAVADPRVPFGGAKSSGYGLEFALEGLKQLGQPQVISY